MQKPVALIIAVLLIIGGGYYFIQHKQVVSSGWVVSEDKPSGRSPPSSSGSSAPSSGGGGGPVSSSAGSSVSTPAPAAEDISKSTTTQTQSDKNSRKSNITGQASKPTPFQPSSSGSKPSSSGSEPSSSGSDSSSGSGSGSSESEQKFSEPVKTAPQNSSPPPPAPKQVSPSSGLIFTESLQYLKSGQPYLGPPADSRAYPIIPDGTSYQGKINPPSNLSQADINRLANYPCPNVTEKNDTTPDPIGSYTTDAKFKKTIDYFIANMGPHIQRKLQTTEWEFTPAPTASYSVGNYKPYFGNYVIREILKVRYSSPDNPLHLDPNVWYRGDIEMG